MTTPLHEQLREASLGCTPPLADLLRRAADAVDGEQKPAAWVSDNVIPLRGLKDNHPAILTATKCLANPIPLYTHPAPIPVDIKTPLIDARNVAMKFSMNARTPEWGEFSRIAQDLDYVCNKLFAGESS